MYLSIEKKRVNSNVYRNSIRFNENPSHWHLASWKPSERPLAGPRRSAQHPQTHAFITVTQHDHAAQLLLSTCANLTGFYWSFGLVRIDLPVPLKAACPLKCAVMDSIYRSRAWSIRFASGTGRVIPFFFTGYLLCWSCSFDLMCTHTHGHVLEIWVCKFHVITLSCTGILKKNIAGVNRLKGQSALG